MPVIGFYLLAEAWDSQPKNQRWRSIKPLVLVCLAILGPATLIGFLFLFVFAFDPTSHAFFHLIHWWTPQQDQPVSLILYWLRNAGPIIVLGCIAAFWPKQRFRPLLVAGLVVFIIANFISFQPWQFDNLKLLTYWYIVWALPIALLIATLPRWLIWLQFILVIMLTGAGLADSLSVTVSTRTGIQLVDSTGVSFAQQVQAITAKDPDGLIVAATNHDNPLSVIAGRRLYVGYEGWLWTYGIDASTRDSEVQKMYSGTTEGFQLIKDKNIHYLALGPQEESKYSPNDKALTGHFTTILQVGDYRLLAVRAD